MEHSLVNNYASFCFCSFAWGLLQTWHNVWKQIFSIMIKTSFPTVMWWKESAFLYTEMLPSKIAVAKFGWLSHTVFTVWNNIKENNCLVVAAPNLNSWFEVLDISWISVGLWLVFLLLAFIVHHLRSQFMRFSLICSTFAFFKNCRFHRRLTKTICLELFILLAFFSEDGSETSFWRRISRAFSEAT